MFKRVLQRVIRRVLITSIIILFCFVAQTSVFRTLSFAGCTPNLLITVTVAFALMRGDVTGLVVGFFCGLLTDVFFGDMIGFYAMIYMYAGFACGRFHKMFFPENMLLPLSTIALTDLAYGLVCFIFRFMLRSRFNLPYYLIHVMLPEAVYTLIVSLLLYPLLLRINGWLEDVEQRSARKFV